MFRGQWPEEHPNRFEANGSDMYQFTTLTQAEAETAADSNGETAIRINLPPIGLNAATVTIEIEKYPGAIAEIDFIVPAIVVIDPGHGGDPSVDRTLADPIQTTPNVLNRRQALV